MNQNEIDRLQVLPEFIRETGLFCVWRFEERAGKRTKIPYSPRTGERCTGLEDYTPFTEAALAAAEGPAFDGIGIGMYRGICGIDIDHCVEGGELLPAAQDIVDMMGAYTEVSPSGTGIHILFRLPDSYGEGAGDVRDRDDYRRRYRFRRPLPEDEGGGDGCGLEVYLSGMTYRYLTLTGRAILIPDTGDNCIRWYAVNRLLDRYMKLPEKEASRAAAGPVSSSPVLILEDREVIEKAQNNQRTGPMFCRLWAGDWEGGRWPSQSEADYELMKMLAFWTGKNPTQMDRLFRASGLMREKYERRADYRNSLIEKACRAVGSVYTGYRRGKYTSTPGGVPMGWDDYIG